MSEARCNFITNQCFNVATFLEDKHQIFQRALFRKSDKEAQHEGKWARFVTRKSEGDDAELSKLEELNPDEYAAFISQPLNAVSSFFVLLGVMPLRLKSPRCPLFHPWKSTFVYSLLVFLGMLYGLVNMFMENAPRVADSSITVDQRIITLVGLLQVMPIFLLPVYWIELPYFFEKQVEVAKYEVLFYAETGDKLTWKRLSLFTTAFVVVMTFVVPITYIVVYHMVPELEIRRWNGTCYVYGFYFQLFAVQGLWMRSSMLYGAAIRLHKHFEKLTTTNRTPRASDLRSNRKLWLALRDLFDTEDSGTHFVLLLFLYVFGTVTVLLYLFFSVLSGRNFLLALGVSAMVVMYLVELYFCGRSCHSASVMMQLPFIRTLDVLSSNETVRGELSQEIVLFFASLNAKKPTFTLSEYAVIDKQLMTSVSSMVVTYLVVMVQFRLSSLHFSGAE